MTGPADAYDSPLSALRSHVDDLAIWITIWLHRSEPDAHARRCASDAVDAIDGAIKELHKVRARLISEIRASDDATAVRADKLLAASARDPDDVPGRPAPDNKTRGAEDTPGQREREADV
jgi:hypothetical protein